MRQLVALGDELRERRLELALTQQHVASASGISRSAISRTEAGKAAHLTVVELAVVASVLGLDSVVRGYPGGTAVRDAGQSSELQSFLHMAAPPLRYRIEVPLPIVADRPERRAWDAVLFGHGERTAIELEMRLRDIQGQRRRIGLKRRDDPTERFLLLVADTRGNRRVLSEFEALFADLRRLRSDVVELALRSGEHPPTGMLLI